MRQKCIAIWVLTTITFISLVHLIESITVIMFNNPIRLLQLYPLINEPLKALTPYAYFYISAITTFIFWGITCLVAFHNPVELYLSQREVTETQLQDKGELLDRMCETVESDHQTLTQLTDLLRKMQKGLNDGQSPNPTTLTPQIQTTSLKSKPSLLKSLTSKTSAQPAKATAKPQKPSLLHRKQKAPKKDENQKTKITTHSVIPSLRKMK
jgi:hypothetical protein